MSRRDLAHFRKTGYSGVYLIYSRNNLEVGFRNSLGYLGDAPRELGDCLVGFDCPSLGGLFLFVISLVYYTWKGRKAI